jgi:small-conductance mechanosensitive channel
MNISLDKYLIEPVQEFFKKLLDFMPNLLSAIIIIVVGIILANVFRLIFVKVLKVIHFDNGCERIGVTQILQKGGIRDVPSHITGRIIYWLLVFIFVIIALGSLRVPSVEQFMTRFLLYLPNVFVAIIIVVLGYIIGNFLGRATLIASVNAGIPISGPLSLIVKIGIFMMSVTMSLEQLGIGEATITIAFGVTFGGIVLALAIAFGLGGKDIAQQYLEKYLEKKEEHAATEEDRPDDISHM